jgi:hypothetical protein
MGSLLGRDHPVHGPLLMRSLREKLTYANVMVTILAVVVLGGGTAYAASELAKESVGTKQLAKEAVTLAKLSKSTKTTLGDGASKGAGGARGAAGPQGPPGLPGTPGAPGLSNGPAGGDLAGSFPNPSLSTGAPGVALASVASTGTGGNPAVEDWFNRFGGAPTVVHPDTGIYSVTFPGMSLAVSSSAILAPNSPSQGLATVSHGVTAGTFVVQIRTFSGAQADNNFSLVVFGASPIG